MYIKVSEKAKKGRVCHKKTSFANDLCKLHKFAQNQGLNVAFVKTFDAKK